MHGGGGGGSREATPYPDPSNARNKDVDARIKSAQDEFTSVPASSHQVSLQRKFPRTGSDLIFLSRRRGVGGRARPGGSGFVVVVASRLVGFVAHRLALLVHRFALMLGLERAGLRRSHARRRARRRARNHALGRARAVLVGLGMDLGREEQRRRQCQDLSTHAISPGNVVNGILTQTETCRAGSGLRDADQDHGDQRIHSPERLCGSHWVRSLSEIEKA